MHDMTQTKVLHTERYAQRTKITISSCVRHVVAITFILSGMLKGVNIDGFSQTTKEFLGLLGLNSCCCYVIAACVCIGEIALGYTALNRKLFIHCHWAYPTVMAAFTCVTYINLNDIYGGIESCGCFGELIHFDPAQSFYKNLVLLMACVALSLHAALTSQRPESFFAVLARQLPAIMIASALPIVYSMIFMHIISQSAYLLIYVAICVISLAIAILYINGPRCYFSQIAFLWDFSNLYLMRRR